MSGSKKNWWQRKSTPQQGGLIVMAAFVGLILIGVAAPAEESKKGSNHAKAKSSPRTEAKTAAKTKPQSDTEAPVVAKLSKAQKKQRDLAKHTKAFQKFYGQFMYAVAPSDAGMKRYDVAVKQVGNGDTVAAYSTLEGIKTQQDLAQTRLFALTVPDSINAKSDLSEAIQEAELMVSLRKSAIEHSQEFLDDGKPSAMSKAGDEAQQASSQSLAAVAKLFSAASHYDVDPTKLTA